jgi:hypothetical protein
VAERGWVRQLARSLVNALADDMAQDTLIAERERSGSPDPRGLESAVPARDPIEILVAERKHGYREVGVAIPRNLQQIGSRYRDDRGKILPSVSTSAVVSSTSQRERRAGIPPPVRDGVSSGIPRRRLDDPS